MPEITLAKKGRVQRCKEEARTLEWLLSIADVVKTKTSEDGNCF